jgi:putative oxidoreductase
VIPYGRTRRVAVSALDVPLLIIGRAIFGGFFLFSGLHHFMDRVALTSVTAAVGVPFPDVAVLGTGLLLVMGGVGLMTGLWPRVGALMIIAFLIGVTPVMHAFWKDPAGPQRMANMGDFLKNVGLLGGACIAAALPARWGKAVTVRTAER